MCTQAANNAPRYRFSSAKLPPFKRTMYVLWDTRPDASVQGSISHTSYKKTNPNRKFVQVMTLQKFFNNIGGEKSMQHTRSAQMDYTTSNKLNWKWARGRPRLAGAGAPAPWGPPALLWGLGPSAGPGGVGHRRCRRGACGHRRGSMGGSGRDKLGWVHIKILDKASTKAY